MNEDKPFTWYKARGSIRIVPRNAKGWTLFVLFMLAALAPVVTMSWWAPRHPWGVVAYLVSLPLLLIGFGIFAARHAEIVDIDAMARDYAEFRKWRDQRGRR